MPARLLRYVGHVPGQPVAYLVWIIRAVNLLLVLWIVYLIVQLARTLMFPAPETPVVGLTGTAASSVVTDRPSVWTAGVLKGMHLFGVVSKGESVSVEQAPAEIPDTRLGMILHGTFVSSNPVLAYAIIEDLTGRENSYTVGSEIPNGIRLHEILSDRVILLNKRRYETLHLVREDGQGINVSEPAPAADSMESGDLSGSPRPKKLPKTFNDLVTAHPVRDAGRFVGFRLKPLNDQHLFESLGLQQDDIITWVNEVDLDNPLKGMQVLRSISSGDYVNMTVHRDGQDISLSFYLP